MKYTTKIELLCDFTLIAVMALSILLNPAAMHYVVAAILGVFASIFYRVAFRDFFCKEESMNYLSQKIQEAVDKGKSDWAVQLFNDIREAWFSFRDVNGVALESKDNLITVRRHGGFRFSLTVYRDRLVFKNNAREIVFHEPKIAEQTAIDWMVVLLTEEGFIGSHRTTPSS